MRKVDSGIWFSEIVRMTPDAATTGCKLCIVGGLRSPNDAAMMRQAGGIIIGLSQNP